MQTLFNRIKQIETQDTHQKEKIKHQLDDTIGITLFATLANAKDCVDIENFGETHLTQLQTYFPLKHGMTNHDTIRRTLMMITQKCFKTSNNTSPNY